LPLDNFDEVKCAHHLHYSIFYRNKHIFIAQKGILTDIKVRKSKMLLLKFQLVMLITYDMCVIKSKLSDLSPAGDKTGDPNHI